MSAGARLTAGSLGDPADVLELAPVIDRLIIGVLAQH
jgi:hypothetical protein